VKENYQDALRNGNYKEKLTYLKDKCNNNQLKRKRRRKIIYFQPPFSLDVKTQIGRKFLKLVRTHFTEKHSLHKILNPRCLKISYCCLPNVKKEITSCNRRILAAAEAEDPRSCNCRKKEACPLDGQCLKSNVVYMAEMKTDKNQDQSKIYIGSAGNTFKERYNGHKSSLNHKTKRNTTELSKWYWNEKEKGNTPEIKWTILHQTKAKYNLKNGCTLCNMERLEIARANKEKLLNKRNELKRVCPHYKKKFF
jgi:hypothetical protein